MFFLQQLRNFLLFSDFLPHCLVFYRLSLLHYAASSDNVEILKILIEYGATVDAMDGQGEQNDLLNG